MLVVVGGEQRGALGVDRDEVQPVPRLRMLGRLKRLGARRRNRGSREPLRHIGIPERLALAIVIGRRDFLAVQRVVHRGVEFQLLMLGQPVVDHPRHLREVAGFGLPLQQRGHHQHFIGRQPGRIGLQQPQLLVLVAALTDERGQNLLRLGHRVEVPPPSGDQSLEAAVVVAHGIDSVGRPLRDRHLGLRGRRGGLP